MATYKDPTTSKDRTTEDYFDEKEFEHIIHQVHDSDFLLEVATVRCLRKYAFEVMHSGYYNDPVSGKARQYDVRAFKELKNQKCRFYLSLECKNIRKNSPLLVSTTPRESNERFMCFLEPHTSDHFRGIHVKAADFPIYGESHVGRSVSQFARKKTGKNKYRYSSGYDQVGEKWTQAISQLQEFAIGELRAIYFSDQRAYFVPILVVPDDTLWEVGYDRDMKLEYPPHTEERSNLMFVHRFPVEFGDRTEVFTISHLHVTTITGLESLIDKILKIHIPA